MLRYLKAAFWVRQKIPLLGHIPINLIALPFFVGLALIHPAFLLIGIGFETLFLWALCSNKKFQQMVDSPDQKQLQQEKQDRREKLLSKLTPHGQQRQQTLHSKIQKIHDNYHQFETESYLVEPNIRSLEALQWTHLKLLFARAALIGKEGAANRAKVDQDIRSIQQDLDSKTLKSAIRKSKEATLQVLQKRLQHFDKRDESLEEIDANLARIEAEVELALDNSILQATPEEISLDVDFASHSMQSVWYYSDEISEELGQIDGSQLMAKV